MSLKLLTITLILAFSLLAFISSLGKVESQEIESNEYISHRDLAIGYVIGRDGSLTAIVGLDTFTVSIPQIANQFWQSITKTIVDENITRVEFANGQNIVTLTLNMTDNILHFDLEGRLVEANLLSFQFSENTKRLGENRTGLRLANGREFYFDWTDIGLQTEFIEGSKSLRVNIRSAPNFKIDPRIALTNPDFETGDFTGWTETEGVNCNILTNSTAPLNGTFSAFIDLLGDGADNDCDVSQSIGIERTIHLQFQFRLLTHDLTDGSEVIIAGTHRNGGQEGNIEINHTLANGLVWQAGVNLDSGHTEFRNNTFPKIILGAKYCVEMLYFMSASANDGNYTLRVNQSQVIMQTGLDNNGQAPQNFVYGGQLNTQSNIVSSFKVDDFYVDDTNRINTCPEGLGPTPPPPPIIVENSLVPSGITFLMMFIILGLVALASNQPWFVIAGWLSMTIAFILFTTGLPFFAIDTNNNLVSFNTVFPQEFNTGVFTFFIIMQFVYPIRIVALVYERLKLIVFGLSDRFAS